MPSWCGALVVGKVRHVSVVTARAHLGFRAVFAQEIAAIHDPWWLARIDVALSLGPPACVPLGSIYISAYHTVYLVQSAQVFNTALLVRL